MKESLITKIVLLGIILMCGSTIKRTIEGECPKVHKQYLKERSQMKWYKRMWYIK